MCHSFLTTEISFDNKYRIGKIDQNLNDRLKVLLPFFNYFLNKENKENLKICTIVIISHIKVQIL